MKNKLVVMIKIKVMHRQGSSLGQVELFRQIVFIGLALGDPEYCR